MTDFGGVPVAVAAVGNDIYLTFSRMADARVRESSTPGPRRVLSLSTSLDTETSQWTYAPLGRLRSHPALPNVGQLVGMIGTPLGPAALLHESSEGGTTTTSLHLLHEDAWWPVPLPEGFAIGPQSLVRLVHFPQGLGIAHWDADGQLTLATADLTASTPPPAATPVPADPRAPLTRPEVTVHATWTAQALSDPAFDRANLLDAWWLGGALVSASFHDQGVTFRRHERRAVLTLTRIEGLAKPPAFAPLHDVGRIAIIWTEDSDARGATPRVVEVSATTGRVMYDGPGRLAGPFSGLELRSFAILLLVIFGLGLIFLFRGVGVGHTVRLPPDTAMMPAFPRMLAFSIDLVLAGWITSILLGVPMGEIFTMRAFSGQVENPWALLVLLLVGAFGSTLLEAWRGRTPGKWLVGGGVTRDDGSGRVPTLAGAAIRNVCKWFVPPLALAGLLDPNLRHRGDVLGRAVVVVGIDPASPDDAAPPPPPGNE